MFTDEDGAARRADGVSRNGRDGGASAMRLVAAREASTIPACPPWASPPFVSITMPNYAIVGAGHIHTPNFVKTLKQRDDATVRAVWDHDADRAAKNAEALGTEARDLEAIWSDGAIDAVIICSETNRHEDLVRGATEACKHLFVEKPLATDADAGYRMAGMIDKAGVIFQTGYFQRGGREARFLKQQIDAGAFGTITRVRHSNCHAGSLKGWFDTDWRWMADPEQAGVGGYGDLGTHSLDILLWWCGKVDRVTASIDNFTGNYGGIDETGEGVLRFESGVIGTLAAGWVSHANPVTMEISGTEGHAALVGGELRFWSEHVDGADGGKWTDLPEALPHAFDLFLDAVAGGEDLPLIPAGHAAYCGSVMAALYEGAGRGTWITPK